MKKKIIALIVSGAAVLTVAFLIFAHFFMTFYKLNEIVDVAAKYNADEIPSIEFWGIELEDHIKLKFFDEPVAEEEYVEYSTQRKITHLSWNKVAYNIPFKATIYDWDSYEKLRSYSGVRVVEFEYNAKKFKWEVTNVERK